jgi:phosphomannomutase
MTLIKSISGIRGTIGGAPGSGLTPVDIVKYTAAYGKWVMQTTGNRKVVIGRDARISGPMVTALVTGTLISIGMDVIDLGLSTTPTVEIAVTGEDAGGGIIITASHNRAQWNALKLLNADGEFISDEEGKTVLSLADAEIEFATVDMLGVVSQNNSYLQKHIDAILALPLVDVEAIRKADLKVVIDGVNSSGGIFVPALLCALGVTQIEELYTTPDGDFPHDPEPLPKNLKALSETVTAFKADIGIAVDPDVDRLCFVDEHGDMFGEEYTLVAVADYVLQHTLGNTVSNLSSTRALHDVTEQHGASYEPSAVGEVNVVARMKETNAVIGGEGNGGIIYPELHYGRDALVGIALFLTHLVKSGKTVSALRQSYPSYYMAKEKIVLPEQTDVDLILNEMRANYQQNPHSTMDGLKIYFGKAWAHLRKSNTEPVIRIYTEASSVIEAESIAEKMIAELKNISSMVNS